MRVIFANRARGEFWSIEELFQTISRALPEGIDRQTVTAPMCGANLKSILLNIRWMSSLSGADLIHITGDIHYAILGAWRCPTVLTIHDLRFLEEASGFKRLLFLALWFFLPALCAQRITVISEFTKSRLLSLCPISAHKIRVIPDCVSPEFQAKPKPWPSSKPRVLQVGSTANKNLERLFDACVDLHIKISILGNLSFEQRENIHRLGLDVEEHHNLSKGQVVALYEACDLVVFASTYEGFGLPILEAQAVGRPVLTSNLPPMREVAGAGALLVDPFNADAIRSGLLQLLNEPGLRDKLVAEGFRNVCQYTATSVADQYADLYREILE